MRDVQCSVVYTVIVNEERSVVYTVIVNEERSVVFTEHSV